MPAEINIAAEGAIDLVMARRMIVASGALVGPNLRDWRGKQNLVPQLGKYARAAVRQPWLVLIDLDQDAPCAAQWIAENLREERPANLLLRVAVREAESWLLADSEEMADFLAVPHTRLPRDADRLDDPKRTLVDLARASRRREIREGLCPRSSSGRIVGPEYTTMICHFADTRWNPKRAAAHGRSGSLSRAVYRLTEISGC